MGTKTQKQRKCCYHNLNAKQLIASPDATNVLAVRTANFRRCLLTFKCFLAILLTASFLFLEPFFLLDARRCNLFKDFSTFDGIEDFLLDCLLSGCRKTLTPNRFQRLYLLGSAVRNALRQSKLTVEPVSSLDNPNSFDLFGS
jgi:hypothetical protein